MVRCCGNALAIAAGRSAQPLARTNNSIPRAACIAGIADAPQNASASAGVGSATVTWNAPASSGGAQIQRYEVQVATEDTGPWSDVDTNASSPKQVNGLAANDTIWFRVRAVTANGPGPYAVTNPVTPTAAASGGGGAGGGGAAAPGGSSSSSSSSTTTPAAPAAPPVAAPAVTPGNTEAGTVAAVLTVSKKPSRKIASAPTVGVQIGKAVTLKLRGLPKAKVLKVKVRSGSPWKSLGKVKTTKKGRATLPTFTVTKAGTYNIQLTTAKGVKYYVKVVVV